MSLEHIVQKITADADEHVADVIGKAMEEAKAITLEYEATAEKEYNQIVDSAYEKANEVVHRANAQGVKEKRINIITAKWEYLDKVFSSAVQLMCELPADVQVRFLAGLIQKYQRSEAELIFNATDRERVGHDVVSVINSTPGSLKVTLSETTGNFVGGLILKEANVEANLTYETIIASEREQLEDEISAILFAG